jgi:hypothetical protein
MIVAVGDSEIDQAVRDGINNVVSQYDPAVTCSSLT